MPCGEGPWVAGRCGGSGIPVSSPSSLGGGEPWRDSEGTAEGGRDPCPPLAGSLARPVVSRTSVPWERDGDMEESHPPSSLQCAALCGRSCPVVATCGAPSPDAATSTSRLRCAVADAECRSRMGSAPSSRLKRLRSDWCVQSAPRAAPAVAPGSTSAPRLASCPAASPSVAFARICGLPGMSVDVSYGSIRSTNWTGGEGGGGSHRADSADCGWEGCWGAQGEEGMGAESPPVPAQASCRGRAGTAWRRAFRPC